MRSLLIFSFLSLFSAAVPLKADSAHLDTVYLVGGDRIDGTVVEDTKDHVLLKDGGVERRFSRDRVLKVSYGDPDAPLRDFVTPTQVPTAATMAPVGAPLVPAGDPALTDYCNGLAEYYQVPVYQVVAVQQRVPMEEVPVVLHLALRAHVAPNVVLGLRLGGLSWSGISLKLGLGNDVFFVEGGEVLVGTPLERLYVGFWGLPRRRWAALRLSDEDIIDCVNVRFVNAYYHRPLVELGRVRRVEHFYHHAWRPEARVVVRERETEPRHHRVRHGHGHEDDERWEHHDRR
jgi:hypothetical protein